MEDDIVQMRLLYNRLGVNKERMMALSDGVFAIAITLLVLDLTIPEIPSQQIDVLLLPSLVDIYPKMIGFSLSFFIIAYYWFSYHRMFSFIRDVDQHLIVLNIFFLFFIAFMPFPTLLLGLYGAHVSVVIFYAAVIASSSFLLCLIWHHGAHCDNLLNQPLDANFIQYLSVRSMIPIGVFLASIGIALASPLAAMISWGSLVILFPLVKWKYTRQFRTVA
ncbi:MAG: DUF1211 domain-containing protein [Methanomicrobiales archaeon]|nr:DUF1211 domain-containing protein [Methanomicrobiales archaeon]